MLHFLKTSVTPLINQHHLYQRYMYVRCASIMINAKCFFVSLVEAQSDKKSKKNKWYRPWLDHATGRQRPARPLSVWEHLPMCFSLLLVLHSGEYYLFESDSEDEEELQSEDQKPQKQTACRVRRQRFQRLSSLASS